MIAVLWGKIQLWLAAAGGLVVLVAGAWFAGRSHGKSDADAARLRANDELRRHANEVADQVDSLDDDAVLDAARKWVRNPDEPK